MSLEILCIFNEAIEKDWVQKGFEPVLRVASSCRCSGEPNSDGVYYCCLETAGKLGPKESRQVIETILLTETDPAKKEALQAVLSQRNA